MARNENNFTVKKYYGMIVIFNNNKYTCDLYINTSVKSFTLMNITCVVL